MLSELSDLSDLISRVIYLGISILYPAYAPVILAIISINSVLYVIEAFIEESRAIQQEEAKKKK